MFGKGMRTLLAVMICGLLSQRTTAADYALDNSHASLIFGVSHLGFSYTYGRFNRISGGFSFDKNDPSASQFVITIDASSIDTNDAKRDQHLSSPDFFDVRQFPAITFQSTGVQQTEAGMQMVGNLTMHGVSKQVEIPITHLGEGKGPYGKQRSGFNSQFSVKRSDFDMKGMSPMIGDEISITFSFEGIMN